MLVNGGTFFKGETGRKIEIDSASVFNMSIKNISDNLVIPYEE